jgi:replicative DNA helicase
MTNEINKLPNAVEFEKVILGSILLDSRLITQALDALTEEDFYNPAHRLVFNAMSEIDRRGQTINHLLVGEYLKTIDKLEQVHGIPGITQLAHGLPHSTNLSHFIATIREKTKARQLIKTCSETITHLVAEDAPFESVVDAAEQSFFAARSEESSNLKPFGSLLEESVNNLKDRMKPGYKPHVLRTGF